MNQALTLVGVTFSFVLACTSARATRVDRQPYILEMDVSTMLMPLRIQECCYMSVLSSLSGKEAEHLCAYKHARFECSTHHAPAREDTWDGSASVSLPRNIHVALQHKNCRVPQDQWAAASSRCPSTPRVRPLLYSCSLKRLIRGCH